MKFITLILPAVFFLSACAAPQTPQSSALTPMPVAQDPPDSAIHSALQTYFSARNMPASTTYNFSRIDLNNDTRRDAIAVVKTPYGYWCDFNGCPMFILRANNRSFDVITHVKNVRGAVTASDIYTHGWRDLILRVSGRKDRPKTVVLRFDGLTYPTDPDSLPAYANTAQDRGIKLLH